MKIFDWLYSVENKIVFVIGSNSLRDLHIAINGFYEAQRYLCNIDENPIYPGFQRYVENTYGVCKATSKGWDVLITEHSPNAEQALDTFYDLLRKYHISLLST